MQKNWLVKKLNKKYFIRVGNKFFRCQIGKGGLKNAEKKIEGDNTAPIGKWNISSLYYIYHLLQFFLNKIIEICIFNSFWYLQVFLCFFRHLNFNIV